MFYFSCYNSPISTIHVKKRTLVFFYHNTTYTDCYNSTNVLNIYFCKNENESKKKIHAVIYVTFSLILNTDSINLFSYKDFKIKKLRTINMAVFKGSCGCNVMGIIFQAQIIYNEIYF